MMLLSMIKDVIILNNKGKSGGQYDTRHGPYPGAVAPG